MRSSKSLHGQVIVVTGSASGIGAETAHWLAQAGADLVFAGINADGLHERLAELSSLAPHSIAVPTDVSQRESWENLLARCLSEFGHVEVLINCAGVIHPGAVDELSEKCLRRQVEVNFLGTVYGTQVFLPYFRRRQRGHFIHIASLGGIVPLPGEAVYSATKFAVRGFCLALALGQIVQAAASKVTLRSASSRTVRTVNTNFASGQTDSLTIELVAEGDENALGFSLSFEAGLLAFKNAVVAGGASGATLNVNPNQSANGRVGVALPACRTFSAGNHAIIIAIFSLSSSPSMDSTTIEFGDQSVAKEIVDANANTLQASWIPVRVTIGMISSVKNITDEVPSSFEQGANHPNPFNPSTTITYALPRAVEVKLMIFDLMGRRVRTLVEQHQQAGRYAITWDSRNEQGEALANGMFIYQLHAGSFVQNWKMALVR